MCVCVCVYVYVRVRVCMCVVARARALARPLYLRLFICVCLFAFVYLRLFIRVLPAHALHAPQLQQHVHALLQQRSRIFVLTCPPGPVPQRSRQLYADFVHTL